MILTNPYHLVHVMSIGFPHCKIKILSPFVIVKNLGGKSRRLYEDAVSSQTFTNCNMFPGIWHVTILSVGVTESPLGDFVVPSFFLD